jgi:ribosomal protein L12E/L44/L45/RPP1/RPP2
VLESINFFSATIVANIMDVVDVPVYLSAVDGQSLSNAYVTAVVASSPGIQHTKKKKRKKKRKKEKKKEKGKKRNEKY